MNFVPRKLANSRFFDPVGWSSLIFRPSYDHPFPSLFSFFFFFWASRLMAFCLLYPSSFSWLLRILHSEILQECVSLSFGETGVIDRKMLELANPLLLLQRYTWIRSQRSLSFYFFFSYQHLFITVSPEKRRGKSEKLSPCSSHAWFPPTLKKKDRIKNRKKTILFLPAAIAVRSSNGPSCC